MHRCRLVGNEVKPAPKAQPTAGIQVVHLDVHHAGGGNDQPRVRPHNVEVGLLVAVEVDVPKKISGLGINGYLVGHAGLPGQIAGPEMNLP